MGKPKVLLSWHGHLFIEWMAVVHYLSGIRETLVVCPPALQPILMRRECAMPTAMMQQICPSMQKDISPKAWRLTWIPGDPEADAYSSLQRAWQYDRHHQPDGFLVGPVDQGPYPLALVQSLLQNASSLRSQIRVPVYQGQRGHPVWLGTDFLQQLPNEHPQGLRGVLQEWQPHVEEMPVHTQTTLRNINTPELYQDFCHKTQPQALFQ